MTDRALALLRPALPGLQAVYVFGSRADGTATAESDLDLAVLAPRPLDPVARWRLQEDVAAALGRDVDLVDLRSATTVMQAQVLGGRVAWEGDRAARQSFEVVVCSAYASLNEERAGILDDVRQRGRVYG